MRRRLFSLCIGACVVAMAACGIPAGGTSDSVTGGGVSSSPPVQSESGSDGGSEEKAASVWGDRIFEKCGIGRDEGGDGGKTLEIRGKRRLSARDGGANYQQS